ncbi:MAG: acetate--CoA ligase family protein [Candidatus Daviesbacteria bacterium]|nr:acetate--CoA ligase family protein [Candidatus Daviesbacteria bacterium]
MPRNLSALFNPKSVAIVGASDTPNKVGSIILKNIINSKFSGQIYPINPGSEIVQGLKCYKSVSDLPEIPDLAIIAIPASKNLEVLNQIGEKGIKNVLTIAAGFKEAGPDGVKLENDLCETAKKFGINILGPNCLGFVNNLCPINATFGEMVDIVGNARFISQSGAIASSLFDWSKTAGLGFSDFITLGNKADINENDILEYFQSSLETDQLQRIEGLSKSRPIGMYLESITDGPKFLEITKQISKKDPIFILKPGKSEAAASAMHSHTGAIAGADNVLEEVLKESHIIRANTLEDFFDLSRAFSWENLPMGPKIAIVSNAGGPGVLSTDAVIGAGLELAQFDEQTKNLLAQSLPKSANIHNPVDVLGDALAERFQSALDAVLQCSNVDCVLVILTPQIMTEVVETAEIMRHMSKKYQKPIFASFIGGDMIAIGLKKLNDYKIPSFLFPERAINAISTMWKFKKWQMEQETTIVKPNFDITKNITSIQEIIDKALSKNLPALDAEEANQVSSLMGIPTPPSQIVGTVEEAENFANQSGWPVVLKVSSPQLLHKKDVGGVVTNINNKEELQKNWEIINQSILKLEANIQKQTQIQIQKQIDKGVEVIIGIKYDSVFGPILLFGSGGTFAELIADRNLCLLPIDINKAKTLVEGSKISKILNGYRGDTAYDLNKLYEIIVRLCKLVEVIPDISDVEINPLIVTHDNAWAVDTKILLAKTATEIAAITKPAIGIQFQTAKVISHDILASTYHSLEFETAKPLTFIPGQYISVKVTPTKINAYSIVAHSKPNRFNLLIDIKPRGLGSQYFEKIKVGEEITYLGPFGNFTLNLEDGAKRLLFLGTGSGIAPLRYQIDSALKEHGSTIPITLYFGLSYPYDLFWDDYFQKLSLDYPNFKFKIAIWKPDNSWHGPSGFITQLIEQDITDASDCAAYLCGNIQMIDAASKILLSRNIKKERIYTEKL